MALKSTIYKATVQVADMDRNVYATHALTLAMHPSETEERLMVRVLAHALLADEHEGADALQAARGLSDADEPALWQHDLTGQILHWVDIGQPDERRLAKACGRARRVSVYAFASSVPVWWAALRNKVTRLSNLEVWQLPASQTQALAALAQRSMQLQVTVQDGLVWVADGSRSIDIQPAPLWPETR